MFELKPIARQLLLACGGLAGALLLAGPATAQQAPQGQEQKLERITITGSNIRRTDTETVAPVEIITREEIERSGKPTVADVLRSVPSATGGSYNESFSNSFAPGASGISLRGLGQKTTLVLINGRRVAGYGFAQNLQDTFVDLNSIPTSAVERIEILKDGASAIYGSDAIAGVVNVILRRDFRGIDTAASVGFFEGKRDYRASVGAGFGDLGSQRFNVFGVLDFYKRDELLMSDTKFGESRDLRGEQGGRNFQSITAGGVWSPAPGSALPAETRRAISECNRWGRVIGFDEAVNLGFIANQGQNPASAGVQAFNLPGNTWCLVDINKVLSALPGTQRIGFMSRGTFDFSSTTQAYFELGLSRNETEQTFTPPFFAGTTGLQQTAAGLRPFTYNVTFAPGVAGNPLGVNARFTGNLYDLGTRDLEITSDSLRALAGLKYSALGFDFDSGVGYSNNEIDQKNINRITLAGTSGLFGVGTGPQPPVPVSTASTCNLDRPSTTPACRGALIDFPRTAKSDLTFVDTKASRELGSLPGGPVGLALGVEWREEKIKDEPDPRAAAGNILGQGVTATDGKRDQQAVYAEFALPLTKQLEAQLALRHDRYSDFGNSTNPKVGLKFKPTADVVFRANWGRGFRAPTLPEISPSVATFFTQVNDGLTNQAGVQISGVFAGNPGLQAERSRSGTLGFVWEPSPNFSIGADVFEINWTNIVGSDSFQSIVNADVASRLAGGAGDPRVIRDPGTLVNGQPAVVTVLSNYRNLSETFVRGADFDVRYAARTGFGRFTTRLNAAYIDDFEEEGTQYAGTNGGTNTYPRLKGTLSQDWEQGAFLVRGAVNYVHSYYQQLLAGSFFAPPVNPLAQTGTYPIRVKSYTTFDLYGRYSITSKLQVSASIVNVTDETPPYDPGFSATFLYDFTQYDIRGRQYRIGVSYKF